MVGVGQEARSRQSLGFRSRWVRNVHGTHSYPLRELEFLQFSTKLVLILSKRSFTYVPHGEPMRQTPIRRSCYQVSAYPAASNIESV